MLSVNSDFLLVLATVFSTGWRIVTSFQIPGTNINVAEFAFGCFMVVFAVKVVPHFLGISSIFERFGLDEGDHPRDSVHPQSPSSKNGNSRDGNDHGIGRW